MSHKKKFTIPAEKVNLSIIKEGTPPSYRLLTKQRVLPENKIDYAEIFQYYINEVSEGKMVEYASDGWQIGTKTSRLFINCKPESHNGGKHVLFYETSSLEPNKELPITWIIKCEHCKKNIPADDDEVIPQSSHQAQSPLGPKKSKKSQKTPISALIVNVEESERESRNEQSKAVLDVYSRVADRMAIIMQNSFDECDQSENPIDKAFKNKTELVVRLALATSEILDELKAKVHSEDQNKKNNSKNPSSSQKAGSSTPKYSTKASAMLEKALAVQKNHENELVDEQLEGNIQDLELIRQDHREEVEKSFGSEGGVEKDCEENELLVEKVDGNELKRGKDADETYTKGENPPKRPKRSKRPKTVGAQKKIQNFLKKLN